MLSIIVMLVSSLIIASGLIMVIGNYCWLVLIGWMLTTVSFRLILILTDNTPLALWVMILVILGFGYSVVLNA